MLKKTQLDELYRKLQEWKTRISPESIYESSELSLSQITDEVRDSADEAVASETVDINASLANFRKQELDDIDAALRRIDENTYGICVDCGVDIEFGRLIAFPAAKRCLDCKSRFEKRV